MDKERVLAILIVLLLIPTIAIPFYEGWVKDMTELATQILSGLVVAMIAAAVALWYKGGGEDKQENPPKLNITLADIEPEKQVKRVEIWLPSGERRYHEARFCFIRVTNSGNQVAKGVNLFCSSGMLLMPFKGKPDYKAEHKWERPEDFDEEVAKIGVETFVIATMDGVKQNDSVDMPPSPKGKTFALFFTMEDFEPLVVPGFTRIYEYPEGSPPTVKLALTIEYENGRGYYTTEFEVVMKSWDNFTPRIVKTTFEPYR